MLQGSGDRAKLMSNATSDLRHIRLVFITCALAQRCIAEGSESVMDNAYDRAPFLFSGGTALSSFKADTAAAEPIMVWMPSKRELWEGVRLDKDSNVYTMEKSE
jgi:hypothetical protein